VSIVSFDKRDTPEQLKVLEEKGGVLGIARALSSSVDSGISNSEEDVGNRKKAFGSNQVPLPKMRSFFSLVLEALRDRVLQILLVGAAISFALGMGLESVQEGWRDGVAIFAAVVIVVSVSSGNDYYKELKFRNVLLLSNDRKVKVMRSGAQLQISSFDLVVGDVALLETGDEVPADGLYISGAGIVADESPLTGETIGAKKNEKKPFLFSGCEVSEGSGKMLVTTVGRLSTAGQIQELLNNDSHRDTPLQTRLAKLAITISKLGLAGGLLTFLALMVRWSIRVAGEPWSWSKLNREGPVEFFVVSVALIVAAIPEGLPLAVTISLAYSMTQMVKDQNFVRHLQASETMGEATCICSDKTGTLTENRMTVVRLWTAGVTHLVPSSALPEPQPQPQSQTLFLSLPSASPSPNPSVSSVPPSPSSDDSSSRISPSPSPQAQLSVPLLKPTVGLSLLPPALLGPLTEAICLNSTAFINAAKVPGQPPIFVGSKTEGALLILADKVGVSYEKLREEIPIAKQIQFSSDRKRMTTVAKPAAEVTKHGNEVARYRVYTKGASEIVLGLCTRYATTAEVVPLDDRTRNSIESTITAFASEGLRTITIAYKDVEEVDDDVALLEKDLIFLAVAGIKDPVRAEVPEAVAKCLKAGIVVRMVTGDNVLTARKIAEECGILPAGTDGLVLQGPDFRALSGDEKNKIIPRLRVLARSSPADKFDLVTRLRASGEVVAVTGDGTNDAPALKEADVGFAMGIAGTDISKNASDIILLDDNFNSIVKAILWGRNVFACIRKFLQFQFAVNVAAVTVTFVGSVARGKEPLTAVQILWVNIVMDSLGALALATDKPRQELLLDRPHRKTDHLVTRKMLTYILLQASYQIFVFLLLLFVGHQWFGGFPVLYADGTTNDKGTELRLHSIVFNAFVLLQIPNAFHARQLDFEWNLFRGLNENFLFPAIMCLIPTIQFVVVQYGSSFSQTSPLSGTDWAGCFIIVAISFPIGYLFHFLDFGFLMRGNKVTDTETQKGLVGSSSVQVIVSSDVHTVEAVVDRTLDKQDRSVANPPVERYKLAA